MRVPPAPALLDLWDAGAAASPTERSLLLLAAIDDDQVVAEGLTLGAMNARLLEARMALFGRRLECVANCPACEAPVESAIDVQAMRDAVPADSPDALDFEADGTRWTARLPTAADLRDVEADGGGVDLIGRLVAPATATDRPTKPSHAAVEEAARRVLQVDPLATIELALACPDCGAEWTAPFHPIDSFWSELGVVARRLVDEVASLARAFGWSEAEILAMSSKRRGAYLARALA